MKTQVKPARASWRIGKIVSVAVTGYLFLGLNWSEALAVTSPVGTTPGTFAVNPNGGANYSMYESGYCEPFSM